MGSLLKHIADIENQIEQSQEIPPQQQKTAPAVKQPVGKIPATPAPVAKVPTAPVVSTPGIVNQNRTLAAKIPMGADPNPQV
jgi:hypothetical protein